MAFFTSLTKRTLYPALLKLEQEGSIESEWGVSDNNRKAKYYKLTRSGRKQLEREARDWRQAQAILAKFLKSVSKIADAEALDTMFLIIAMLLFCSLMSLTVGSGLSARLGLLLP